MLIISGILNFDNNIYETIIYWILLLMVIIPSMHLIILNNKSHYNDLLWNK